MNHSRAIAYRRDSHAVATITALLKGPPNQMDGNYAVWDRVERERGTNRALLEAAGLIRESRTIFISGVET